MKRSEINRYIASARRLLDSRGVSLPSFARWSMEEWAARSGELGEIRAAMLGWDVTDYAQGRFESLGAVLFTARNGVWGRPELGSPYAEKYIIMLPGQFLPCHCHRQKTEDIINRSGGPMEVRLWESAPDGSPDPVSPVGFVCDGLLRTVAPGEPCFVEPGSGIRMHRGLYHVFGAPADGESLICGEVSSINDDITDNYFVPDLPRFTVIEEDTPPLCPLCNEYDALLPLL